MLHVNIIHLTCRGQAYANVQKNATQNCIDKFVFVVSIFVQMCSSHIKDTENSFSLTVFNKQPCIHHGTPKSFRFYAKNCIKPHKKYA